MSAFPDIRFDSMFFDMKEDITFLQKTGNATFATAVTISQCLRRAQQRVIDMGGDRFESSDLRWHIWTVNIPPGTAAPKYGDNISDAAGVKWIILKVAYDSWLTRYACDCKRLTPIGVG